MNTNRPWNIAEQVVEDPTTKMRLEFSSVHSEEVAGGGEAPSHDRIIYLKLWTTARDRMATFVFTRGGDFVMAQVEPVEIVNPLGAAAVEEAMNYNEDHPQGVAPREFTRDELDEIWKAGLMPKDEGQLVDSEPRFEDINLAKDFTADI